jgi:hypothetical protein
MTKKEFVITSGNKKRHHRVKANRPISAMIICGLHISRGISGENGYFFRISCRYSHPHIQSTLRLTILTSEISMNMLFCSK